MFCNKIETCRKVENLLSRSVGSPSGGGTVVLAHHAAIDEAVRQRNLKVRRCPYCLPHHCASSAFWNGGVKPAAAWRAVCLKLLRAQNAAPCNSTLGRGLLHSLCRGASRCAEDSPCRSLSEQAFLAPPLNADQRMVLVCTDRASRGIDSAHVEHVVGLPSVAMTPYVFNQ